MNYRYLYPSPGSPWAVQVDETHKPLKYKAQSGQSGQSTVSQKFFIENTKMRLLRVSEDQELTLYINYLFTWTAWTAWTAWPWPILERGFGSPTSGDSPSIRRTGQGERIRVAAGPVASCLMENKVAPRANDGRSSHAPYWPCNRTHNPATGSLASVLVLPLRQRAEVQFTALTVSTTVLSADHRSQPVDSTCLLPAGPQSRGLFSPPWRRDAGSIGPIDSSRHIAESFRSIGGVGATGRPLFLSPVSPTGMATRTKSKNLYKFSKVPSTSQKRKGEVSNGR